MLCWFCAIARARALVFFVFLLSTVFVTVAVYASVRVCMYAGVRERESVYIGASVYMSAFVCVCVCVCVCARARARSSKRGAPYGVAV